MYFSFEGGIIKLNDVSIPIHRIVYPKREEISYEKEKNYGFGHGFSYGFEPCSLRKHS